MPYKFSVISNLGRDVRYPEQNTILTRDSDVNLRLRASPTLASLVSILRGGSEWGSASLCLLLSWWRPGWRPAGGGATTWTPSGRPPTLRTWTPSLKSLEEEGLLDYSLPSAIKWIYPTLNLNIFQNWNIFYLLMVERVGGLPEWHPGCSVHCSRPRVLQREEF